ncbi:MAG: DUF4395 domain-containing protein [Thermomicrobia bacterium]|nr:DUF4395 domain-containing protein [Thermomicrobia bacterium]MCA1723816.1 DUF4395 domain-containing protein [Thermomicrobia bacterium]
MATQDVFTFPNPVNEVSARVVAAGVVAMATTTVVSRRRWLIVPLAYGFVARALTGPTLSPLGQLATRVITPRLGVPPKAVAGPPKRFAQMLGACIALAALALAFPFKRTNAAFALVGMIAAFATMESGFGFCIGCKIFAVLMKIGVIPEEICVECANIRTNAPVA